MPGKTVKSMSEHEPSCVNCGATIGLQPIVLCGGKSEIEHACERCIERCLDHGYDRVLEFDLDQPFLDRRSLCRHAAMPPKPSQRPSTTTRRRPGEVRDAIVAHLTERKQATVEEIHAAVAVALGGNVPASSVRSYLNLNTPGTFERTSRGRYRLS